MTETVQWGRAKLSWLREFIVQPHGAPSHDTFGRVRRLLDAQRFEQSFRGWPGGGQAGSDGGGARWQEAAGQPKHSRILQLCLVVARVFIFEYIEYDNRNRNRPCLVPLRP